MSELVRLERQDGVAWITLDRAEVRNALSYDTLGELSAHAATLATDTDTRVVCITGAGAGAGASVTAGVGGVVGLAEQPARARIRMVCRIGPG